MAHQPAYAPQFHFNIPSTAPVGAHQTFGKKIMSSSTWRIVCGVFALMASAACLFSLALLVKTAIFVGQSEVTTGRIDRIEFRGGKAESWAPIFSYQNSSGVALQGEGMVGDRATRWSVGQQVGVRFHPSDPSDATLDTFRDLWSVPLMVFGFSVGLLAFFVWLGWGSRNRTIHGWTTGV
jgi:hypothetical protein